ncbi:MAG: hypothetical protein H0X02_10960 [Nitrosomonas sp.]|nr:hypothetical protein [Nitrosomonas sp.]
MPNKTLPIEKVRELLRLKFEEKLTDRMIARALGIGHMSAYKLTRKFSKAGQTWPTQLSDAKLQLLFYQTKTYFRPIRVLPDFEKVRLQLEGGKSLRKTWQSLSIASSGWV